MLRCVTAVNHRISHTGEAAGIIHKLHSVSVVSIKLQWDEVGRARCRSNSSLAAKNRILGRIVLGHHRLREINSQLFNFMKASFIFMLKSISSIKMLTSENNRLSM